jgi:hypothetical protein
MRVAKRKTWLAAKIAGLEFTTALVIVASTRAYAEGSYTKTALWEAIFVVQWFVGMQFMFDKRSRTWNYGFPAYLVGAVAGALVGLWLTR